MAEILYCIRCGACLNACPVFREIGGHAYVNKAGRGSAYPGPMGSVLSPALLGQEAFGQLARASTLCGACKEACPVDIDLPKLLLRVRAGDVRGVESDAVKPNAPGVLAVGLKAFSWMASGAGRFRLAQGLAGTFGGLGQLLWGHVGPDQRTWLHLPAVTGWGVSKDFPAPTGRKFRQWMAERSAAEPQKRENGSLGKRLLQPQVAAMPQAGSAPRQAQTDRIEKFRGLSGAQAALPETGSLLITGGLGRPLAVSLLPEIHIVVVSEAVLFDTLAEILNLPAVRQSSAAALVSRPSRTADIEMTLTIGVHGPGEIHVFFVQA